MRIIFNIDFCLFYFTANVLILYDSTHKNNLDITNMLVFFNQITFHFNIYLIISKREDQSYLAVSYPVFSCSPSPVPVLIEYWDFPRAQLGTMFLIASAAYSPILCCFEDFLFFFCLSNTLALYLRTCFRTFSLLVTPVLLKVFWRNQNKYMLWEPLFPAHNPWTG